MNSSYESQIIKNTFLESGRGFEPRLLGSTGAEGPERSLSDFYYYCRVELQKSDSTTKEYRRKMRRFFSAAGKPLFRDSMSMACEVNASVFL